MQCSHIIDPFKFVICDDIVRSDIDIVRSDIDT